MQPKVLLFMWFGLIISSASFATDPTQSFPKGSLTDSSTIVQRGNYFKMVGLQCVNVAPNLTSSKIGTCYTNITNDIKADTNKLIAKLSESHRDMLLNRKGLVAYNQIEACKSLYPSTLQAQFNNQIKSCEFTRSLNLFNTIASYVGN